MCLLLQYLLRCACLPLFHQVNVTESSDSNSTASEENVVKVEVNSDATTEGEKTTTAETEAAATKESAKPADVSEEL